mmetsp:Transcript_36641/g.67934  ORF Transcript_36641/g.67934 Transcript_36641/m.67934 type:complete len:146 (+) Transcript_36641:203-640(+)
MSYHTPDSKKEEFRRYLERSGAIDSLTSVLVGLYEENDRPSESTDYIKNYLSGNSTSNGHDNINDINNNNNSKQRNNSNSSGAILASSQHAQQENEKLRKENKELKNQVKELNKTIETLRANLKHSREEAKRARMQSSSSGGGQN